MGDGLFYVLEVAGKGTDLDGLISKLKETEKILPKVKGESEHAGEGHKKHSKEAEHLGSVLQKVTHQALHPFLERAKRIAEFEFVRKGVDALIEAPMEIVEKLKELGEEMLMTAAKAERTNKSFKLLFGEEKGGETLEFVDKLADHTEFTVGALKAAAGQLGKVGFHGQDLRRAMLASTDMAALSGNKEGGMDAALSTLEMVKRTGRVGYRTLGGLGISNKDFLGELSQRTGDSVEVLKKKMAKGKVDASDAIESLYTLIAKKTGKKLGGAGADMGNTLGAKLTHLQELPERYFEKLADSPGLKNFTEVLGHVLDELSPDSPKGQAIFAALDGAFTKVSEAVKDIDIENLASNFEAAMTAMADSIGPLLSALKGIGTVLDAITPTVKSHSIGDDLAFKLDHKEAYLAEKKLKAELALKRADKKAGIVSEGPAEAPKAHMDRMLKEASNEIKATEGAWVQRGKYLGDGLYEGVAGSPKGGQAGEKLAADAHEGFKEEAKINSPSRTFAELGKQTAAGFAVGVDSSSGMVDDVMAGAFAVPAPQGGRSAGGGGGVSIVMGDIYVGGGGDSRDTAEAVRAAVRAELLEQLEQFRVQQGV